MQIYTGVRGGRARVCACAASEVSEALSFISVGTGTPFVVEGSLDTTFFVSKEGRRFRKLHSVFFFLFIIPLPALMVTLFVVWQKMKLTLISFNIRTEL